MRQVAFAAVGAAAVFGCFCAQPTVGALAKRVPVVSFMDVPSVHSCYVTPEGAAVFTDGTVTCPEAPDLTLAESGLYERLGRLEVLPNLDWVQVTFTDKYILCGGVVTTGCTYGQEVKVSRHDLMGPNGRAIGEDAAFAHELGHELRLLLQKDGDPNHADCRWWLAVDKFDWPPCAGKAK